METFRTGKSHHTGHPHTRSTPLAHGYIGPSDPSAGSLLGILFQRGCPAPLVIPLDVLTIARTMSFQLHLQFLKQGSSKGLDPVNNEVVGRQPCCSWVKAAWCIGVGVVMMKQRFFFKARDGEGWLFSTSRSHLKP